MNAIDIPCTLMTIVQSWEAAEQGIRDNVLRHGPGLDETEITSRFHEAFARKLDEASQEQRIETAFLEDLRSASLDDDIDEDELRRIATGLIAEATLHPTETERKTGGDLGLVIVRPSVTRGDDRIVVSARHKRGLLCQAKLKYVRRPWGKLKRNQEEVLPKRIPYLRLLLYRYLDPDSRMLAAFSWQVCAGHSLADMKTWLKKGSFPGLIGSRDILMALGSDKIGTSDPLMLDKIVAPTKSRYIVVRIDWPDGHPPETSVQVFAKSQILEKEKVEVRVQY